jgi:hypothetical protein
MVVSGTTLQRKYRWGNTKEQESEPGFELPSVHKMDQLFEIIHGGEEKE